MNKAKHLIETIIHPNPAPTACPKSGKGVQPWIHKRVLYLIRQGYKDQQIIEYVSLVDTANCGKSRAEVLYDIRRSLRTGRAFKHQLGEHWDSEEHLARMRSHEFKTRICFDPDLQKSVLESVQGEFDWKPPSETPLDCLRKLFGEELICFGIFAERAAIRTLD